MRRDRDQVAGSRPSHSVIRSAGAGPTVAACQASRHVLPSNQRYWDGSTEYVRGVGGEQGGAQRLARRPQRGHAAGRRPSKVVRSEVTFWPYLPICRMTLKVLAELFRE